MTTCLPYSLIGSGSVNTLPILFHSTNSCTVLKGVVDKVSTTFILRDKGVDDGSC